MQNNANASGNSSPARRNHLDRQNGKAVVSFRGKKLLDKILATSVMQTFVKMTPLQNFKSILQFFQGLFNIRENIEHI